MSVQTAIAFATFFLENDHVLTFYEGSLYLANNFCPFYGGRANCNGTVGVYEQYVVELNAVALFLVVAEIVDIQLFAGFGAELLSLDFYNCVHVN